MSFPKNQLVVEILGRAANLDQQAGDVWMAAVEEPISLPCNAHAICRSIEDTSWWFQHRNRCILQAIERFPPALPIFDIGGGNGCVSAFLEEHGIRSIVVEPGMDGALNARARGLRPVVCASFDTAGFARRSLPACGLFDVLEHIEDGVGFLERIRSAMCQEARLYLTVPAYQILWSCQDEMSGHFRRYSLRALRSTAEQAGYIVEYATYIFAVAWLPVFFARALPSRFGIKREGQARRSHSSPLGLGGRLFSCLQAKEVRLLDRASVPFGTSCLVVLRAT